jgi:hypothetical protein
VLTAIAVAWQSPSTEDDRNLKVLPKDISSDSLSKIMDEFVEALNVDCAFCHAAKDPQQPKKLHYSSDANHLKEVTRTMMRMTYEMNDKYMKIVNQSNTKLVTCNTCHRGKPVPEEK